MGFITYSSLFIGLGWDMGDVGCFCDLLSLPKPVHICRTGWAMGPMCCFLRKFLFKTG